ncbi:MAG: zinc metallopeptidase [Desulfomonilia bacterium]|jgi:Zn-dependent membrane protease YugP|nr:zinc metallopeptidase [Deltaproteobacteria bacterium]MDX9761516.1 zinc metallopeptidase [Desulfomonilia bacterium]
MIFDPLYIIMIVPALILSVYAQIKVKSTYAKFSKVSTYRGITGAQAAREILRSAGVHGVNIELTRGFLSDHYDPRSRVLRLSESVYSGDSIASVGVAAHEAGHAIQHAHGYAPLKLRSALVPISSLGSNLAWPLLIIGFIFMAQSLILAGIVFFSLAVLFQIVTLPVEFNASSRALQALPASGILSDTEVGGARKVLSAAALTYVAAATAAVLQLVYFLLRAGLLGNDD